MKNILVLHGPNLNLLGLRQPSTYGNTTLEQLNQQIKNKAEELHLNVTILQSNNESELIDTIHSATKCAIDFIVINPAAFTHTSIALRDALLAVQIPFIEIHISNIYARETFRHQSYFSDIATGVISGLGSNGYLLALQAILNIT